MLASGFKFGLGLGLSNKSLVFAVGIKFGIFSI